MLDNLEKLKNDILEYDLSQDKNVLFRIKLRDSLLGFKPLDISNRCVEKLVIDINQKITDEEFELLIKIYSINIMKFIDVFEKENMINVAYNIIDKLYIKISNEK